MSAPFEVSPLTALKGEVAVPGDKSISHRAAILAGLSNGECLVRNFLPSEDCVNTLRAMGQLGVKYEVRRGSENHPVDLLIGGCAGRLSEPSGELDCGNSGTGMRLLSGVLAAQDFGSVLVGDESLSSRPMGRVITPLEQMGAKFETRGAKPGCAPIHVAGGSLNAITYEMPMASAQVKSAVLLAGLFARGKTTVVQPAVCRDHTERLLEYFGVKLESDGNRISLEGGQLLQARDLLVPGDISSAAFWLVAASCLPGASLKITNVGLNPTRTAILDVLKRMGAEITVTLESEEGGEPSGTIAVTGGNLRGTTIQPEEVPNLIDEVPILAVAGALAEGSTTIRNAGELRVKETDRIETTVGNLRLMGGEVEEFDDGMVISGGSPLVGAQLESYGDHRIAMAFTIAGWLAAEGRTIVRNTACVATSYPGFCEHLELLSRHE